MPSQVYCITRHWKHGLRITYEALRWSISSKVAERTVANLMRLHASHMPSGLRFGEKHRTVRSITGHRKRFVTVQTWCDRTGRLQTHVMLGGE